jgi:hypothetical protein
MLFCLTFPGFIRYTFPLAVAGGMSFFDLLAGSERNEGTGSSPVVPMDSIRLRILKFEDSEM